MEINDVAGVMWFSPKENRLPLTNGPVLIAYRRGEKARIANFVDGRFMDTYSPDHHGPYPLKIPLYWAEIPDPWENVE